MVFRRLIGGDARPFRALLHASCAIVGLLHAPHAIAGGDENRKHYSIQSQDAASALRAFAVASDRDIVFEPSVVAGKTVRKVDATLSDEDALRRLLAGTDLEFDRTQSGGFVVRAAGKENAASNPTRAAAEQRIATAAPRINDSEGVEEVFVTAQRRREQAQDTPISITTFTANQIESKQILDVTTMVGLTPGVSSQQAYNPFDIRIQIRGISLTIPSLGVDPPVGVYVDGVYYALTAGSNAQMIDMEQGEVLKGPQGTLFGRNTIGGALNITTKKPTNKFEGSVEGVLGNYDQRTIGGVLNVPIISDRLAARFVFQHNEHDGYGKNTLLNKPLADLNQNYVRGTFKVTPNDAWELLFSGNYMKATGHASPIKLAYLDTTSPLLGLLPYAGQLAQYVGGNPYRTQGAIDPPNRNVAYGGNATITGHLGEVTVKSITSFVRTEQDSAADQNGTPFPLIQVPHYVVEADQFSQELQAYGDLFDSRLSWIGGLYYFHDAGDERYDSALIQPILPPLIVTSHHIANSSYAAFAQLTYRLTDKVRVTGGVRYTRDKRAITYLDHAATANGGFIACVLANNPGGAAAGCALPYSASFSYVPWTIGLDYKPSDEVLLYAKVSTGHRSGGYGLSGPAPGATPAATAVSISEGGAFKPEKLVSPEVGAKLQAFDNRLRVNAAAFYSNYSKIQQATNIAAPGGGVLSVTRNVGNAHIWGGEVESEAVLGKLHIGVGISVIRPKYVAGPKVGSPVVNTPKFSWSTSADYPIEMSGGTLTLHADYSWRSNQYFFEPDVTNRVRTAANSQPAYGLLGAQISMDFTNIPLTVALWGQNLTEKRYRVETADLVDAFGFVSAFSGIPRTYGIRAKYQF